RYPGIPLHCPTWGYWVSVDCSALTWLQGTSGAVLVELVPFLWVIYGSEKMMK
ncbi:hypothetical protein Q8A73_010192, partial [Channa argus]